MAAPLYPVEVRLVGRDGNAFAIMARVAAALRKHLRSEGKTPSEVEAVVDAYMAESQAGDYGNLLRTAMRYVEVT